MARLGKSRQLKIFEKVYFDNYNLLCQTVWRFVKDEEATKDIVQEVFVKYWQRINEIHITESKTAYLRRACINAAINYLKETERRDSRQRNFASESQNKEGDRPDVQLQFSEVSSKLQSAIEDLPPACRAAFFLSRHEGKSYKEIGEILSISINTVEKHIGKALKRLRKGLSGAS